MLSYLVLAALQIVAAWYGEPHVTKYLPSTFGPLVNDVFEAVVYAVIVWIVGFAASFVLKIREPGSATLVTSLVFALIGVAIVVLLPTLWGPLMG